MAGTVTREIAGPLEIRAAGSGNPPLLVGSLPLDQWAEVNNPAEGHFMERIVSGAFSRSIASRGSRLRLVYEHGKDPQIGRKPLGGPLTFDAGPGMLSYQAELLDAAYARDLLPGLRAGVFGSSFSFEPLVVDRNRYPSRSAQNPAGLEERTVNDGELFEISVTPFPVYAGATAGVRSETAEGVTVAELDELIEALDAYLAAWPSLASLRGVASGWRRRLFI